MDTKFKTRINAKPDKGELCVNRELLTRPDESKSMREILFRFQQGIPLSGRSNPVFNPEWEHPDLKDMDLVDIEELKEQYSRTVSVKRKALMEKYSKDRQDEEIKQKAKLRKEVEAEIRADKGKSRSESNIDV